MKLLKLQIFPKGRDGWASEELLFADHITQIYGPNGSGKTPIVQSISFCLGYPNEFRNDIYERCNYAVLSISTAADGIYQFKRYYTKEFHIEIREPNGFVQTFFDEATHSAYMFELMGFETSELVDVRSQATLPYMSSLLPIFYLDQDYGYGSLYAAPSNFVKDQFSEMVRMIFRLSPKNSVDEKRQRRIAKENLDILDRRIQTFNKQLDAAKSKSSHITATPEALRTEIESLEKELEQFKTSGTYHDETLSVYDRLIAKQRAEIRHIDEQINEIRKRESGITKIIEDINVEIETVSLNEGARRVFMSFDEICGSANCQLFSHSSGSYSKNLLYLKDQLKDLERNRISDSASLTNLEQLKTNFEAGIQSILEERNASSKKPEISALVDAISRIKNQVFELQSQLSELDHISVLEEKVFSNAVERNKAYEKLQSLSNSKSTSPELIKLKHELKDLFIKWLDAIHTTNISKNITFVDDFVPVLGVETIKQLKGSTKIRAVLAFHAALIELLVSKPYKNFRFIILDTPKQQDTENLDLDGYIKTLKTLSTITGVQVVFSTTGYHYEGDNADIEWLPKFPGDDHLMYLKRNDSIDIINL
ncbi:AAA family ATPase [Rheinheimera sp. 4Y26]|uniref:AAA family ATPase n=1 Tax=Rheinheimera sp. 4Y26 TaxID=2977811 RepID=UPI0021B095EE|nr:AAA family ATPase [Rheinheimera sp. 4Y26]MCT6700346.1 AAA family ATPase [Rheinheimera sp. 4Y26]